MERGSSKPLNINNALTVPQRTEETSKGSLDEKSPQRSPSKLKGQLMSPSLVPAKQKEQAQNVLKRKCSAEEPPRSGKDSGTIKTREPSETSVSKDLQQRRGELVKRLCSRQQNNEFKATKSLCTEAKTPSATSASSKDSTSISSSNVLKNVTSMLKNDKSMSHKTAGSSSAQQPICSIAPTLTPNFKIPKMVQSRPVDGTGRNKDAISTNRNFKHGTQLSNSGASVSNSKQTVQQAHSSLDVTPSLSFDGRDERSFLSGKLPATSDTVTEPWCDEVIKSIIHSN